MKFKIATPERIMLETEADSITLPTSTGEITILPHHIPLVSELEPGEIRYKNGNRENFFAVSGGIIEVSAEGGSAFGGKDSVTQVVVLADSAEFGHEIDLQKAEQARQEAIKLMSTTHKDDKSLSDAVTWLERSQARIKVAKKHRTHKQTNLPN